MKDFTEVFDVLDFAGPRGFGGVGGWLGAVRRGGSWRSWARRLAILRERRRRVALLFAAGSIVRVA